MNHWEYGWDSEHSRIFVEPDSKGIDVTVSEYDPGGSTSATEGWTCRSVVIPTHDAIALANFILLNAVPGKEKSDADQE